MLLLHSSIAHHRASIQSLFEKLRVCISVSLLCLDVGIQVLLSFPFLLYALHSLDLCNLS